jgi:hypothetical protein
LQKVTLTVISVSLAMTPRHKRPDRSLLRRAEDGGKSGMERNALVVVAPDKRTKVRTFKPAIGDIERTKWITDADAARPNQHINDGLNGFEHLNLACDDMPEFRKRRLLPQVRKGEQQILCSRDNVNKLAVE